MLKQPSPRSVTHVSTKKLKLGQGVLMSQLQKYPQFADITFLGKVGETLRQAIGETATSDLPEDIRLLLRRLERMERRQSLSWLAANNDPGGPRSQGAEYAPRRRLGAHAATGTE